MYYACWNQPSGIMIQKLPQALQALKMPSKHIVTGTIENGIVSTRFPTLLEYPNNGCNLLGDDTRANLNWFMRMITAQPQLFPYLNGLYK